MAANVAANVVKEKCIVSLKDEENSKEGSSWTGCDGPRRRLDHQSCVRMDEEDIGRLSKVKCF